MLPDISNAFILFGGGLAFLLALVQLIQARSRFKNILLFIIFSSLAVIQVQGYAVSSTHFERTGLGMMIFLMSKFILAPSIYIFYLSVFRKDYVFSSKEFVHFLPSLFVSLVIVIVLLPPDYRDGLLSLPYLFIEKNQVMEHLHSLGYALILGYLLAIFSRLEVMKVLRDTNRERLVVVAITVITILFLITAMIIISMITNPEVFLSSPAKNRKMHRIEGLLQGIDVKKLQENLDELLVKEKLYCDEDLSLKRLADLLSIQQQELSVYLNHYLQMNFNSYLNKYRVDEAILLMKEDKERSLLSIAFAVGFNSKSVFYDAFTKQTGLSPARYRKTFLSSN
ncbi:MAG: hypothetical protein CVV49_20245 [Spirochaetae bacterium HGW-Spirochaetae-5]|nr:MAG: hypothetical protein CVV49_20245 [Spirochaetae bacterium HGW-Spirochaetae-5]